jgi:hypothetical protein
MDLKNYNKFMNSWENTHNTIWLAGKTIHINLYWQTAFNSNHSLNSISRPIFQKDMKI